MKAPKKKFSPVIAIALAVSVIMVTVSVSVSAAGNGIIESTPEDTSVHEKVDISDVTNEIAEPPELTSAASALATEKEWYEYVYYSSEPVGYYYLTDNIRISFYDPYDYANSLVMEVDDTITDWSSSNSLQVCYTTGNSLVSTEGKSTDTSSSVQRADGSDISETETAGSTVKTTVEGRINTYNWSKAGKSTTTTHQETDDDTWTVSETILGEISSSTGLQTSTTATAKVGVDGIASAETSVGLVISETIDTKTGVNVSNTNNFGLVKTDSTSETVQDEDDYSHGYTEDGTTTTSVGDAGYSKTISMIADRITSSIGKSASSSVSISTSNSTTVTKTYDAGYFNSNGAPLQWKIIKYKVEMPMKYQMEYLVDGEWVFLDYNYCLLTTIQGTCRAYMQNNVAYYEHWGTGEPVTWDEFWSQFFTKESLIQAYQNKLYPDS